MKNPKGIIRTLYAPEMMMGDFKIRQPFPNEFVKQISPFVLFHHAPFRTIIGGKEKSRLGPHPHRGFEPVTFLFEGEAYHRDSTGNSEVINSGDVQWMTAGSGIIHSEGPTDNFLQKGGNMELVQLWVNLPKAHKMTTPGYQHIKKELMPEVFDGIRLVSGSINGVKGPANTFTNIISMMGNLKKGDTIEFSLPSGFNSMVYLLSGELSVNGENIIKHYLLNLSADGEDVHIKAHEDSRILILSGEPINEPLATYGPFVMNTFGELQQAITDYEDGKMGNLDF